MWQRSDSYGAESAPNQSDIHLSNQVEARKNSEDACLQGESVFVAAHTSAGKTVVAEYAFALAVRLCCSCFKLVLRSSCWGTLTMSC